MSHYCLKLILTSYFEGFKKFLRLIQTQLRRDANQIDNIWNLNTLVNINSILLNNILIYEKSFSFVGFTMLTRLTESRAFKLSGKRGM